MPLHRVGIGNIPDSPDCVVVGTQLSEYIRSTRPDIKGFSKRNIYNMVMFYDEYSSELFAAAIRKYMTDKFVQSETAQI